MLTKKDSKIIAGIIKEQRAFADTTDELNRIDGIAFVCCLSCDKEP